MKKTFFSSMQVQNVFHACMLVRMKRIAPFLPLIIYSPLCTRMPSTHLQQKCDDKAFKGEEIIAVLSCLLLAFFILLLRSSLSCVAKEVDALEKWSTDINSILKLVETTCHLIRREYDIHKVTDV